MTRPGRIVLDLISATLVVCLIPLGFALLTVAVLAWGVWQIAAGPFRRLSRVRRIRRLRYRLTARRDRRRCAQHHCMVCQLADMQPSARRRERFYNVGSRR